MLSQHDWLCRPHRGNPYLTDKTVDTRSTECSYPVEIDTLLETYSKILLQQNPPAKFATKKGVVFPPELQKQNLLGFQGVVKPTSEEGGDSRIHNSTSPRRSDFFY